MNRSKCISALLKRRNSKTYLEIGVDTGRNFFYVRSADKYAVDPEFKWSAFSRIRRTIINPYNLLAKFYPTTSDEFFAQQAGAIFSERKIDVCLVDGMHEYEFALRDIENSVKHLKDDGVIVVHDCNPTSRESACSFKDRVPGREWNGDVWKAIVHIRSLRNDLNVFVLDCDHGLGIITKKQPENMLSIAKDQIANLSFEEFDKNRGSWLNLKTPGYFNEFFKDSVN